ncbi:MAG TPA: hypothetical protein PL066_01510 [bacterium]|nr:hypothetical protein [bacterium]
MKKEKIGAAIEASGEKIKFEIGRQGAHEFEVYETVEGEDAAIAAYLETIEHVAAPSEICIFEEGGSSPRKDLQETAESKIKTDKPLDEITLEDELDMDTAKQLGFNLRHGANWYDYHGQPMSLDRMAKMEANSIANARRRNLQTGVDPSNGVYVDWEDSESPLAKEYRDRVQKYISNE